MSRGFDTLAMLLVPVKTGSIAPAASVAMSDLRLMDTGVGAGAGFVILNVMIFLGHFSRQSIQRMQSTIVI